MSLQDPWKKLADSVKDQLDKVPRIKNAKVENKLRYKLSPYNYKPVARDEFGGIIKQKGK